MQLELSKARIRDVLGSTLLFLFLHWEFLSVQSSCTAWIEALSRVLHDAQESVLIVGYVPCDMVSMLSLACPVGGLRSKM